MKNIIWQKPDGGLAITFLAEDVESHDAAQELLDNGNVPSDWTVATVDCETLPDLSTQEHWRFVDGAVVVDTSAAVAGLKAAKIAEIQSACTAAIYAGFSSSALGAPRLYPAKDKDQLNLNASVTSSLLPNLPAEWTTPFWCADKDGNWAYVDHTAAQIQQVGKDGKAAILENLTKCQAYIEQVNAAATAEDVGSVAWE